MDERISTVLEEMENLISESNKLTKKVQGLFSQVKERQDFTLNLLTDIHITLTNEIEAFQTSGKDKIKELDKSHHVILNKISTLIEDNEKTLHAIYAEYESKVSNLVTSIDNKSKEILTIYDELGDIQKTKYKYHKEIEEQVRNHKTAIQEMKDKQKKVLKNLEMDVITKKIELMNAKIGKLETFSHTHIFGGRKV